MAVGPTTPAAAAGGTLLSKAMLSRVQDIAVDPVTGRPAFATGVGAYVVEGSGADARLVRALDAGAALVPGPHAAGGTPDLAYGPDGTLYMASYDPTRPGQEAYVIEAVRPDGSHTVIAGQGSVEPAAGAPAAGTKLGPVKLAVSGDGTELLFAPQYGTLIWAVNLTPGLLRRLDENNTPVYGKPAPGSAPTLR